MRMINFNRREARATFDRLTAGQTNPDQIARLELAREYFTNPEFRRVLEQITWEINERRSENPA